MSRFFAARYAKLVPYTPGEQPQERQYIKLNTNESPFPPAPQAIERAREEAARLERYPDPDSTPLRRALAAHLGVTPEQILLTNGSDDILNFAFQAFCDAGAVFPNVTYGFYSVFAALNGIPYEEIPLRADFSVDLDAYRGRKETIFLANPNAQTGIALPRAAIETLVRENPDRIIVVDEAYVDFGAESCVPLIKKYENLLVTQTFSKSRSMAGARLGFGVGSAALIGDLNTLKYSTNPYNINRMTMAAGLGALEAEEYTRKNCETICRNREFTEKELKKLGFTMTPSSANFLLARHERIDGGFLYRALKERGILVRHFDETLIAQYNRITIGSRTQMEALLETLRMILEETR